ncbi:MULTISPECIES: hypothetical protein [Atlantibacter]|uniref:hypothetical protein n=1 Tax=Atlantibacter TaxID=1903434 RepID=UPI00160675A2|nr:MULTISPECIES: hypothetical protein [Atlantibacter]MBB3321760.1 hypothetical protein [Atlantibacter sp. RC6]MBL7634901.1 hypothetical protein [Atlantibacter hermannii]MBL7675047.1 hypothetical protein [Atlantibacter hermannii]MCZ7832948.1 hypothetical protein [Atlantibacter hermannii]
MKSQGLALIIGTVVLINAASSHARTSSGTVRLLAGLHAARASLPPWKFWPGGPRRAVLPQRRRPRVVQGS